MRWLVNLYPRQWRQRYGAEFGALLEASPTSARLCLDVARGALDAHLTRAIERGIAMPLKSRLMLLASACSGLVAIAALLSLWFVQVEMPWAFNTPAFLQVERHLATKGLTPDLEQTLQEAAKSMGAPAIYVFEGEGDRVGASPGPILAAYPVALAGTQNDASALVALREMGAVSPARSMNIGINYSVKAPDGKTYGVYIVRASLGATFKENARLVAITTGMVAIFLALWTRRPSVAAIPIEPR